MNESNRKAVWKAIQTTGDLIKGALPPSMKHPAGRNPYAHIASCVKSKWGMSYKDIPDEEVVDVIDYLNYLSVTINDGFQ